MELNKTEQRTRYERVPDGAMQEAILDLRRMAKEGMTFDKVYKFASEFPGGIAAQADMQEILERIQNAPSDKQDAVTDHIKTVVKKEVALGYLLRCRPFFNTLGYYLQNYVVHPTQEYVLSPTQEYILHPAQTKLIEPIGRRLSFLNPPIMKAKSALGTIAEKSVYASKVVYQRVPGVAKVVDFTSSVFSKTTHTIQEAVEASNSVYVTTTFFSNLNELDKQEELPQDAWNASSPPASPPLERLVFNSSPGGGAIEGSNEYPIEGSPPSPSSAGSPFSVAGVPSPDDLPLGEMTGPVEEPTASTSFPTRSTPPIEEPESSLGPKSHSPLFPRRAVVSKQEKEREYLEHMQRVFGSRNTEREPIVASSSTESDYSSDTTEGGTMSESGVQPGASRSLRASDSVVDSRGPSRVKVPVLSLRVSASIESSSSGQAGKGAFAEKGRRPRAFQSLPGARDATHDSLEIRRSRPTSFHELIPSESVDSDYSVGTNDSKMSEGGRRARAFRGLPGVNQPGSSLQKVGQVLGISSSTGSVSSSNSEAQQGNAPPILIPRPLRYSAGPEGGRSSFRKGSPDYHDRSYYSPRPEPRPSFENPALSSFYRPASSVVEGDSRSTISSAPEFFSPKPKEGLRRSVSDQPQTVFSSGKAQEESLSQRGQEPMVVHSSDVYSSERVPYYARPATTPFTKRRISLYSKGTARLVGANPEVRERPGLKRSTSEGALRRVASFYPSREVKRSFSVSLLPRTQSEGRLDTLGLDDFSTPQEKRFFSHYFHGPFGVGSTTSSGLSSSTNSKTGLTSDLGMGFGRDSRPRLGQELRAGLHLGDDSEVEEGIFPETALVPPETADYPAIRPEFPIEEEKDAGSVSTETPSSEGDKPSPRTNWQEAHQLAVPHANPLTRSLPESDSSLRASMDHAFPARGTSSMG